MADPAKLAAIDQCERDIAKLQEELKRLKDAAKPKPRNGDIVRWTDYVAGDAGGPIRLITVDASGAKAWGRSGTLMCGPGGHSVQARYDSGTYILVGNVFDLGPALGKGMVI